MKIFCGVLTLILVVLGFRYSVLYMDYQTLREQLARQETDFENRLQQERDTFQKKIDSLQDFIAFGQNDAIPTNILATDAKRLNNLQTTNTDKLNQFIAMQEENLQRTLEKKYGLLMSRLRLSGVAQNELQALLEQREKVLNAGNIGYYASQTEIEQAIQQQQQSLAEVDRQIDQLLSSPEDREIYQLLKDSAYEQYQMNNFFDQAEGDASIPQDKREAILMGKLEQKREFTRYMESFAKRIQDAPSEEKSFLMDKAREALNQHKENFLSSVQDKLTPQQFEQLSEREQKQFEEIWRSLKAGWEANP